MKESKMPVILVVFCLVLSSALQAQTTPICYALFSAAKANLEKKDKEARSPLKQFLDRRLNPAKTIRGGIDDLLGKSKKGLPGKGDWQLIIEQLIAIGAKECIIRPAFRKECGCNFTGLDAAYANPNQNYVANSPNRFRSIFAGDSLARIAGAPYYQGWSFYTGVPSLNHGVGMATSDDNIEGLNYCASTSIYGHYDRTQQNPQPNPDKHSGSKIFQNKNIFLRFGGNDFKSYKVVLQTLPILIPFRHGNVLNNYNRYITYVQAQSGANVTILGPLPFPSMDPLEINRFGYIGDLLFKLWTLDFAPDRLHPNSEGDVVGRDGEILGDIGKAVNPFATFLRSMSGSIDLVFSTAGFTYSKITDMIFSKNVFSSLQGDETWLSQRMLELNFLIPIFTANRQVDYIPFWHVFMNWDRSAFPWMANPYLYTYEGGPLLLTDPVTGSTINDSIHPNQLGYMLMGAVLSPYMKAQKLDQNTVPFGYYDGCNYEPKYDPMNLSASAPDALDYIGIKPGAVPPPIASAEPPPLPAVNDNDLLIIAICLFTGACW